MKLNSINFHISKTVWFLGTVVIKYCLLRLADRLQHPAQLLEPVEVDRVCRHARLPHQGPQGVRQDNVEGSSANFR